MNIRKLLKKNEASSSEVAMTDLTHYVLMEIYDALRTRHPDLNGFACSGEWIEELSNTVIPPNSDYRATRKSASGIFETGNVKLVQITCLDDTANYSFPTIGAIQR